MSDDAMKKPELLVPASSLEVLKIAVIYGADAVYIGGEAFGLRAKAKNFSMDEISTGSTPLYTSHVDLSGMVLVFHTSAFHRIRVPF